MKAGDLWAWEAFVLVGGRSSRMGQDKALLPWDGLALARKIAQEIAQTIPAVTLIGDPEVYGHLGLPVVPDIYRDCGPLGGIHAALTATTRDWNLIAACDMPDIHRQGVAALVEEIRGDADCVIPVSGAGQREPLFALYHRRCLQRMEEALNGGVYKISEALAGLRIRELRGAPEMFRNVNTPGQWNQFLTGHV